MKFCTAICCMDGRIQEPVIKFMKDKFDAKYVDMITEAGVDKVLSDHDNDELVNSLLNKLNISVKAHGSNTVAVVGHYDCTGNPVPEYEHVKNIGDSMVFLENLFHSVEFIGLWVDEGRHVNEIHRE